MLQQLQTLKRKMLKAHQAAVALALAARPAQSTVVVRCDGWSKRAAAVAAVEGTAEAAVAAASMQALNVAGQRQLCMAVGRLRSRVAAWTEGRRSRMMRRALRKRNLVMPLAQGPIQYWLGCSVRATPLSRKRAIAFGSTEALQAYRRCRRRAGPASTSLE